MSANPHRIVEAVMVGALAVGASVAFIALPPDLSSAEAQLLEDAVQEAPSRLSRTQRLRSGRAAGICLQVLGGYIIREEAAFMELIEGKVGRPRTKPPLPTAHGLFGMPTVINNLETVLNAYYILKVGAETYRQVGQTRSPVLLFLVSAVT